MRIIFMGTPGPAARILERLSSARHEIVCVVTQPDRPKGRGQEISFPPVKETALRMSLPIEQPEKVKGNKVFISLLESLKPDIIVVVAYGRILPKEIINLPRLGCINVHASLLPKYRGAAPIQWALLNGEEETGVTIMQIDELLDTGDIILQKKVKIEEDDNAETLSVKLFDAGALLLLEALGEIERGKVQYAPQKEADATFAPALAKESAEIDWHRSAREIHNRIRALLPWPVAHTFYKVKRLKIYKSEIHVVDLETKFKAPGAIVQVVKKLGFIVATGAGHILIREVQPEDKKRMGAYEFAIGHAVTAGETLPD
jgi:methionyl-tRNA formyltransferase